ncbi:Protein quiver, partial [Orchesella cincta]
MNYLEFALFSAIIFPLFSNTDGADECRTQRLLCYDCDSRYDPYCGDPFNRSLPQELRPPAKVCHGCCVKFVHKFPDNHVCMNEGKGHGQMCFCEHNLCNGGPSTVQFSTSPFLPSTLFGGNIAS